MLASQWSVNCATLQRLKFTAFISTVRTEGKTPTNSDNTNIFQFSKRVWRYTSIVITINPVKKKTKNLFYYFQIHVSAWKAIIGLSTSIEACVYISVCVYIYIHTHTHTHTHVRTYIHTHTYICYMSKITWFYDDRISLLFTANKWKRFLYIT